MEKRGVAGWHEYARTLKLRGCRDQRLQVLVALTNRVTEEGYGRRVGFNSAIRFGNHRSSLLNCILKLAATVVSVDSHAEIVACSNVVRLSGANEIARRRLLNRTLHAGERLAHHEAQLRVKGERPGTWYAA